MTAAPERQPDELSLSASDRAMNAADWRALAAALVTVHHIYRLYATGSREALCVLRLSDTEALIARPPIFPMPRALWLEVRPLARPDASGVAEGIAFADGPMHGGDVEVDTLTGEALAHFVAGARTIRQHGIPRHAGPPRELVIGCHHAGHAD